MLKNTGLIGCIKARELHRPEAEEIFHVGLLVRSAALVLLLQSEADRLLSYLLAANCNPAHADKGGRGTALKQKSRCMSLPVSEPSIVYGV